MKEEVKIVVFLQTPGRSVALDASATESLAELLARSGPNEAGHLFAGESTPGAETDEAEADESAELVPTTRVGDLAAGGHLYLHHHPCRRIKVTVNYGARQAKRAFLPSARVSTVLNWAKRRFGLTDIDADKLLLQICQTHDRPRPNQFLGELAHGGECALCFDLVPDVKVEG